MTQHRALEPDYLKFFSTPAFICRHPDADAINPVLKDLILQREGAAAGLTHSNLGGWHSGLDFKRWGGPALQKVLDAAARQADRLTRDRRGRPVKLVWDVECWANVNRHGHANKRHTHPGCFWSGTYYVASGGPAAGANHGGEFEFQDPRGASAAFAEDMTYAPPGAPAAECDAVIRPRDGVMVMFPSWMPHRVRPYFGSDVRISIAFNLAIRRSGS